MPLPHDFLSLIKTQLGDEMAVRIQQGIDTPGPVALRVNPKKVDPTKITLPPVPWCHDGFLLVERPSFTPDPWLWAGAYYVQDASSMAAGEVVRSLLQGHETAVLDLCAAPGGKSTHLSSVLPEGVLLVSNEVIRARCRVLEDNLERWGRMDRAITTLDPDVFSSRAEGFFDTVLCDAPCSGEGMFRRDFEAQAEWSLENVALCTARQKRILEAAWRLIRPGGVLIYTTCTLNRNENEDQVLSLVQNNGAVLIPLNPVDFPGTYSGLEDLPVLRFYPGLVSGEGQFVAALRKPGMDWGDDAKEFGKRLQAPMAKQLNTVADWLIEGEKETSFFLHNNELRAISKPAHRTLQQFLALAPVITAGLPIAHIDKRGELLAHAALATAEKINSGAFTCAELSLEQSWAYLQRNRLEVEGLEPGWALMQYEGQNLGWAKAIQGGRINNYLSENRRMIMVPTFIDWLLKNRILGINLDSYK